MKKIDPPYLKTPLLMENPVTIEKKLQLFEEIVGICRRVTISGSAITAIFQINNKLIEIKFQDQQFNSTELEKFLHKPIAVLRTEKGYLTRKLGENNFLEKTCTISIQDKNCFS